ncbi:MAG: glycoside hydrolase family 31 protein [Myxococcales bacterium]|nr:glycoside hydrolase family 31 protein [Myxococcales bacterium]
MSGSWTLRIRHRLAVSPGKAALPRLALLTVAMALVACGEEESKSPVDAGADAAVMDAATDDVVTDTSQDAGPTLLPAPTTQVAFIHSGNASLEVNLDRRDLRLTWQGKERTVIDLDELRLGRVPKLDTERNYAPTTLESVPIPDLAWLIIKSAKFVDHPVVSADQLGSHLPKDRKPGTDGVTLAIAVTDTYGKAAPAWQLHIDGVGKGAFRCHLELTDPEQRAIQAADEGKPQVVYTGLSTLRMPGERYYGLGEWFDRPEHTGTVRAMQIEVELETVSGYNEAHVPVPFIIGTGGWGLFVKNRRPAQFDVAKTHKERVEALFHDSSLEFWLFTAAEPLQLVGAYTQVTGAPTLPAPWALGPLIWRNENKSDTEVLDDMAAIRKHDLAISGMWFDRPFDTHVNNFEFDPDRFKDADAMLKKVHAAGFATAMWSTPYVEKDAAQYKKVLDAGWYVGVPKLATQFLKWGPPLDLTNPETMGFWREQVSKMAKRGITGWKLDFAEDIHPGLFQIRTHYTFHDGSDERTMHHGYPLVYHKPYFDNLPKDGGFILARAGTYGGQTLASMIWPGDLDASFHPFGWCGPEAECSEKPYVGGLPSSVSAMLGLAASGYPIYAADTGGYRGGRPTKALFLRWMAQTAFSAAMQIGGSKQCNPWDFDTYVGKWGTSTFDKDVLKAAKRYTRLHMRLIPYLYSHLAAANAHKIGLVRPFGLAYAHLSAAPQFGALVDSQYLLGDAILVAPVLTPEGKRDVLMPPGGWYDWWSHDKVKGPATTDLTGTYIKSVTVAADGIPVWLRAGAVVPMLRPTIDTLYPATDKDVDSFAATAGRLHVIVAPGPASTLTLVDGTVLSQKPAGKATEVKVSAGSTYVFGWELEVWQSAAPKVVAIDGTPAQSVDDKAAAATCEGCWWFDADTHTTHVRLAKGPHVVAVLPK